jgi:hypothetical protein
MGGDDACESHNYCPTVNAMQAATAAIIMINFCWQQSPLVKAPYTVFYYSVNSINDSVLTIKK